MRLILARHGKAVHNVAFEEHQRGQGELPVGLPSFLQESAPLVEVGERQARAAGAYLRDRGLRLDVAFISPAVRTRRTWAEYGFAGVPTVLEPRLKEQDGGVFDRLPLSVTQGQRERYAREAAASLDARPPQGESIREHLARVEAWLRETVAACGGATVLAVTHYGVIGLIGALCEGLPLDSYLADRPAHLTPGYGDLIGYRRHGGHWVREFLFHNPCR
ncbi:MAG: histidine phosphatase family protein [Armatimonadetes bacterium]|nr:histidine phosphatase family protein [Armatimonadota bacterium]